MASRELRSSIYRIISDLIKSDNTISVDELEVLEQTIRSYGITGEDILKGHSTTLADAVRHISMQKPSVIKKVLNQMASCAMKDGEYARSEAMLITAIEISCEGKGQVISMPLNNRPILSSQILYVDPTYNPKKNDLDKKFEDIKTIAEIAGFDLIYIPDIAKSFKQDKSLEDLKRLLYLINPALNEKALTDKAKSLQDMDSRFFYIQVLNEKLQMGLNLTKPTWLVRLQNSIVNGTDYANYFCYDVSVKNISNQLKEFTKSINSRLNPYSIIVNRRTDASTDFSYRGFHKALLDVMASDRIDSWELKVYIRGGASSVVDTSGKGERFSVSLHKGEQVYPVHINGREAAFYLLLLCASAGPEKSICFEYDRHRTQCIQEQYQAAYRLMSNRESHTPDITLPSTFRPIKTKVLQELSKCGVTGNLHLFKPTKRQQSSYYIPLPSENIKIVSSEGETALKDSTIFKTFVKLMSGL